MRSVWLRKTPKSINDLWKIVEEAKESYEEFKDSRRKANKEYEEKILSQGVYVHSIVKVLDSREEFKDKKFEVIGIRRNIVKVRDIDTDAKWNLKNFKYEVIKDE